MTGADIVRFHESLKASRLPLEHHVRQCYQYSHPIRGVEFGAGNDITPEVAQQQAAQMQAGLNDSTVTDSANILASTLVSGMTPANSLWFGFGAGDDASGEVKAWLDGEATEIHKGIHSSNYDSAGFEAMLDVVDAGWCALYIEEGEETDYMFETWPLASCWFATTKKGGLVDTVIRQFTLTAQQAVREYGSRCPEKIVEAVAKNPYQRFPFLQYIAPKSLEKGKPKATKDALLPFDSFHVCTTTKRIVRSGGYAEFPVAVPRWLKLPNSVYAQGPVSFVLPDAKTLNEVERLSLANGDMQISGMWGAVDDGVLNPKTVRIGPKKIIMMKSKDSFFPINPPGKMEFGSIKGEEKRSTIRRMMMADQLGPLNEQGPARTATEWHYRVNLLRQLLGPMFGRMQSEFLQTVVFRCFYIKLRKDIKNKKFPPEPLRQQPLRLRYISPLARAQQMEDVAAMDRFEMGLLDKSKVRAETMDVYDWDAAERKRGELLGVPQSLILTPEKIKELRKVREDQAAKAAQGAQAAATPGAGAMMPAGMPGPGQPGGKRVAAPSPSELGGLNV
jgi:hypothetical protein